MSGEVLLLNQDHVPLCITSLVRAVGLMFDDKVQVLREYGDRVIRSPSRTFPWPAVLLLRYYVPFLPRVRYCTANVFARDRWACQYCGVRLPRPGRGRPNATIDHVVPRAKARDGRVVLPWNRRSVPVTGWANTVAACQPCNQRKGSRTPAQAGMSLRRFPRRPSPLDSIWLNLRPQAIPPEWDCWVPETWRDHESSRGRGTPPPADRASRSPSPVPHRYGARPPLVS